MHYNKLHKKETYAELINYIQNKQPILKYPNRLATQLMNSRELLQLDGLGVSLDQQDNLVREQQRENLIMQQAEREGTTAKKNIINEDKT